MNVEIKYSDNSTRTVTISDEILLQLAVDQAEYEDMTARESAKKTALSVKAK